ncbi:MAG: argininosuccinate synthase [Elusimicrobia bacterium RIFCSPLOWO2_02_FULL_39_32]|nr:MAG: argininosuccinate synthase [Elusimicrobia bacterium RIFCSPHIGHO2_02_FULL_39_36]OGR92655.1 MAG: argininosuccinate synthase [Elusimicrobia bacterium RIFCSPLOWO2_02_FULL_39_32]OGR99301.1 MAG: argininosuccinate synthase [Elusimicrobia bacterium RIFCSPLOWO2_12_FULL_39_28]
MKKVVLAYSGGLDTSIIIRWLIETYHCEVIAACVNLGSKEGGAASFKDIEKKALATGAKKCFIVDGRKDFAENFIFPALKSRATYESKYLLATSLARPLIAKEIVRIAKEVKADALSHGATGKGNDQVRFEIGFRTLMPGVKIIAPWREWDIHSREDAIRYAQKYNIPIPVTKDKPYSSDANMWHISYEGGILENLEKPYPEEMFQMTVSPEKAPVKATKIEIEFKHGVPVSLNGKKMDAVSLILELNKIGGQNGVGRIDIVENRLVGMKSRGVYECPAATILYQAHRELETITLDRETFHFKDSLSLKIGELIYYGLWFTTLRRSLSAFIDETQKFVSGKITMELYKGNIKIVSRNSPHSLYWEKLSTFGYSGEEIYDHKDSEGFIKLFGLPHTVESLLRK